MAPATVADVPDLMARCRQCALAGNYSASLQLHSQARAAIKSLLITLGSSEEERVRKAKWMGLIVELDAEIQLVKVRCAAVSGLMNLSSSAVQCYNLFAILISYMLSAQC
jgi:hypothetical protein